MDVARLNFAHGELALFQAWIGAIREEAALQGKVVAILQDLPGPKLRTGPVKEGAVTLKPGARLLLRTEPHEGSEQSVHIDYAKLPDEVAVGDPIFIDDGRIRLRVVRRAAAEIETEVVEGGRLRGGRGVNVPESALSISAVTERDLALLDFGLAHGVDWVALSFVRSAEEIEHIRAHAATRGKSPKVMAKIERREALARLDDIIRSADGVMVARGDLGVEISVEQVPMAQKQIIALCNRMGKPVVTATQMLESMVEHPEPTRAEVADVANAVLDGTDAVMLSQETSLGTYPLEAIRMMDRVAREVEDRVEMARNVEAPLGEDEGVSDAVAHAACHIAGKIGAKVIAAITRTGRTAERISAARPNLPVVAMVSDDPVARGLVMYRGVIPWVVDRFADFDRAPEAVALVMRAREMAAAGDRIVLTGGVPSGEPGSTSFVRVLRIP
jgi:pyruvate kinase